jgi:hypothetical protein
MPVSVDWTELQHAFEFASLGQPHEHEAVLCRKTGKFLWLTDIDEDIEAWPDDADDEEKYLPIPHKKQLDLGKPLVIEFARQLRGSGICCSERRRSIDGTISRPRRLKRPCGNGAKPTA